MIDFNKIPTWDEPHEPKEIDFVGINDHGLSNIKSILERYMPGGRFDGHEYRCAGVNGGKGDSCSTNIVSCVGAEFNGSVGWNDPISLVAAATGQQMGDAAKDLADYLCIDPFKPGRAPARNVIPIKSAEDKTSDARKVWAEGIKDISHPYLQGKQVPMHDDLRVHPRTKALLIPLMDEYGVLHSIQRITETEKKCLGPAKGHFFKFNGSESTVYLAEGYATAATIAMATGCTTYMCVAAGFMSAVTEKIKDLHPKARIVFAADHDAGKNDGSNPGIEAATKSCALVMGRGVVLPPPVNGGKPMDWNDYYITHGLDKVKDLLTVKKKSGGPNIKSANSLLSTEFEPIRWAIEGLLPEGLAILSGPPKLGKSWLSLDFCLSIVTGGMAANQFVAEKGEALLCAMEDNDRRLKSRLQMRSGAGMMFPLTGPLDFNKLDDPDLTGFHYTTSWRRLDLGGLQDIAEFLDEHPACKLIVLDTLAKVKPVAKGKGNAYENDYNDMGALQSLALEKHCCILVITHNRKTETDDDLQSISGSTGITGVMDTILILKRKRGANSATLMVTGRDISEHTWALNFDGQHGAWTVVGDHVDDAKTELQEEVFRALEKGVFESGRGMTPTQLFDAMGGEALAPSLAGIKKILAKYYDKGIVHRHKGAYMPKVESS